MFNRIPLLPGRGPGQAPGQTSGKNARSAPRGRADGAIEADADRAEATSDPPQASPGAAPPVTQAKFVTAPPTSSEVLSAASHGITGSGSALPFLQAIQRSFGRHDVSRVVAHTGKAAAEGASRMGAEAFAMGNHVAFAGSPSLHTAAHEAAHAIQQRAGVQLSGGVGQVGDVYEQHADTVADRVVRGLSSESLLDAHAGGSGVPKDATQRSQAEPWLRTRSKEIEGETAAQAKQGMQRLPAASWLATRSKALSAGSGPPVVQLGTKKTPEGRSYWVGDPIGDARRVRNIVLKEVLTERYKNEAGVDECPEKVLKRVHDNADDYKNGLLLEGLRPVDGEEGSGCFGSEAQAVSWYRNSHKADVDGYLKAQVPQIGTPLALNVSLFGGAQLPTQEALIAQIRQYHGTVSDSDAKTTITRMEGSQSVNNNAGLYRPTEGKARAPKALSDHLHCSFGSDQSGCTLFFARKENVVNILAIGHHDSKQSSVVAYRIVAAQDASWQGCWRF